MRRKRVNKAVALFTATVMAFGGILYSPSNAVTASATTDASEYTVVDDETLDAVLSSVTGEVTKTRNSVHDPSVVVTTENGVETFYIFGSHMGVSKTTDLLNWTSVTSESEASTLFGSFNADGTVTQVSYNQAFRNNAYTGQVKVLVDGVETLVDFGTYDASAWNTALDSFNVQGNMWAPDVIYNPTMGKWCMYLSLNGNQWNSSIILLTADNIAGPYIYQGPVIYSGFNGNNADVIDPLATDLDLIYPNLSETGLPEKYTKGGSWGTFWPHAIDPCVSYDENGNLYMIYGSWSGGIYALQLDEATGLRDYTVVYPDVNAGSANVTSDAYFGTKIAGGAYSSGEGAYIEKIGNYWYLFMSYGFYSPDGGYEMRIFRSDNIAGPYVDSQGVSAIFPSYVMNYGVNGDMRGEKLMAGYKWDTMTKGEIAQGHNSVATDSKGNTYLVYHTKFNDGSVAHELRVHQLFVNEAGWLVAAPYEYTGQTVNNGNLAATTFETEEIVGEYQVLLHKYNTNYAAMEIVTPVNVLLKADGTVSGAYSGTWNVTNGSFVNLVLDGVTYQGVLVKQMVDGAAMETLCFTAAAANGVNVWGSKLSGDEMAIALTRDGLNLDADKLFPVGGVIYQGVDLPVTSVQDAVVTWLSSNEAVLSSEGKVVSVPDTDTEVTLTCQITKGNVLYQKAFEVTVAGKDKRVGDVSTSLVSKFEFEGDYKDSVTEIEGVAEAQSAGTAPSVKSDSSLNSKVAQLNFGYDGASSSNYVKFANPLKGSTTLEATISLQVKRSDTDVWDALWGFMDADDTDGVAGRLYLTPNAYLGYNGTDGWFDANHAETVTNAIPVGEWSLVTVTLDTEGFQIYVDGELCYDETHTAAYGSGDFTGYSNMMNVLASADVFYLGYGSWWGTASFRADDLMFFDSVLDAASVNVLYEQMQAKINGAVEDEEDEETEEKTLSEINESRTYYNDFEAGLGDATVVGSGQVETVDNAKFGNVYHNATGEAGVRTNYLLLPSDTIADAVAAGTNELSVGFWVNVADAAGYFYSPLFMAYGAEPSATGNTWPMFALQSRLLAQVNCAGWCDFTAAQNVAGANTESTVWLDDKEWHYYTATVTKEKVCVYVDGVLQNAWEIDGSAGACTDGLFTNGAELDYVCLGGNQAWDWADADASYMFDQVAIYSTALTPAEIQVVMSGEEGRSFNSLKSYVTYYNDFEDGLGDTAVVGSGEVTVVEDDRFGGVYHNATGEAGVRTNYLLLPNDTIADAVAEGNDEMTVAFWVNVADAAGYFYSPLFMAYGSAPDETTKTNTWPMLALQSRLLAQVNCAGYCDFTAAQNVAGTNTESTVWLDDKEWHYYTATVTKEKVCVYVDGVLQNAWEIDGSAGACVDGLFTNGAELDYVCLGGNQAWDWADADASYMFDQVAIFSTALTDAEIAKVMAKAGEALVEEDDNTGDDSEDKEDEETGDDTEPETPVSEDRDFDTVASFKVYGNTFEDGLGDTTVVGSGQVEAVEDAHFGNVYHNATGDLGVRTNYLLLPSDVIADAVNTGNEELTVSFWVNVADATNYWFSPIFTAYGDAPTETGNSWPMFALQSRLLAQVNCAGWTDLSAAENVAGSNTETTVWLDDKEWHFYTATVTPTSVCVYVDGVLQNQWTTSTADGNCVAGLFSAGSELDYVCLGGNQAWDWADADASYMFDDVAIYATVLSAGEIADVMEAKYADKNAEEDDSQQGGSTDTPSTGGGSQDSGNTQTPSNPPAQEEDSSQTPDVDEPVQTPDTDDEDGREDREPEKDRDDQKPEDEKPQDDKDDKQPSDKEDGKNPEASKGEKRHENMKVDSKEAWNDVIERTKAVVGEADITISMDGQSQVPGEFITELKGQDINVVFELDNGITWTVNGNTVSGEKIDVDFHVDVNSHNIPMDVVEELAGKKEVIQISLAHDGEFGCQPVLTLPLEKEQAGKYANLYYYNEKTGIMEFMASGLIDEEGKVELRFVHASEYAIVIDTAAYQLDGMVAIDSAKTPLGQIVTKNNVAIYVIVIVGIVLGVLAICYGMRKKEEE